MTACPNLTINRRRPAPAVATGQTVAGHPRQAATIIAQANAGPTAQWRAVAGPKEAAGMTRLTMFLPASDHAETEQH